MKITTSAILIIIIFCRCSSGQSNDQITNSQTTITEKEIAGTQKETDTLGAVIATIDFRQKATGEDLKTFENEYIPWINIDNPNTELNNLVDADKIILPFSTAKIIIDYPLSVPVIFEIRTSEKGFSRKQLILEISAKYQDIYKLEEKTAKTKTIPVDKREGLINRNSTDGKFGVWGHDIADLDLSEIEVHKSAKGQITLTLYIES